MDEESLRYEVEEGDSGGEDGHVGNTSNYKDSHDRSDDDEHDGSLIQDGYLDEKEQSSVVQRHLTFDNEKEKESGGEEDDEDDEKESTQYHQDHHKYHYQNTVEEEVEEDVENNRQRRDKENTPLQDDDVISRKFDASIFLSAKRKHSSDSLDDLGTTALTTKNIKGGRQQGRGREGGVVMSKVNIVWIPTKTWLGEVWRDLTCTNASHCVKEATAACQILFRAADTWSMCLQYLLVGLIMSFICEVVAQGPQHNTALLLVLIAGFEFHFFPTNSVRPQLVLSVLVATSFVLDIMLFAQPPQVVNDAAKVLTSFVFLAKGLALYNFLCLSDTGSRAKKYLWRRIRVFFVPLSYPRKPMREIRSRILAIEFLQGGVALGYMVLFIFGFMTIGGTDVMSSPAAGLPLVAFLPIKFLTSSGILMVLMIDTDVTLCLAYFGCLGGMMSFVKAYIHSKYQEYGGWPLSYALNPYRVYAVVCLKFIDVCFGFAGWAALGTTFSTYYSLGYNIMALVAGAVTLLVVSDLWVPVLFFFVVRMLQRHEVLVRHMQETEEDSDDSELDEFDIRNNEKAIKKGREMRYRNLNQGFMKTFKSKYSVGSSSSDEGLSSSSSDDNDQIKKKRRKKKKIRTGNNDNHDYYDGHDNDDENSNANDGLQLDINLDMALGGNGDDNDDNSDEDSRDDEESDRDESNRLTSPGPLHLPKQPHPPVGGRREARGQESPNLLPAAHGWGRHNKISASASPSHFSPGKGSWGQATTDAVTLKNPSRRKVSFDNGLSDDVPPPQSTSMKLPPLAMDTSSTSPPHPAAGKGRPPSVPKLQLSSVPSPSSAPRSLPPPFSPALTHKNYDEIDSDVEYTFDSPFQPKIRTKTGTPIQPSIHKQPSLPPQTRQESSHITIEESTSISPDRYTEMWDEMDISASFSAQLYPEDDIVEQKLVQLVTHLQAEHFYVVAAGEADNVLTIYGFASGFKKSDESEEGREDSNMDDSMHMGITAVSFLMELKIHTDSSAHPQGLWSFECNCKCSSPPACAVFIKMMLLGDCLHLVKN